MSKHKVDEIRNVAFVGHGHSGKTTLADLLLFKAGVGTRAGSVDDGTSLLDTDEEEKEKKQSIFSHVCRYEHADHRVNLTLYQLGAILEGDLDPLIEPLIREHQAEQLAALAEQESLTAGVQAGSNG